MFLASASEEKITYDHIFLLGILETNFKGLKTLNDLSIRKSTSTFASANIVIDLNH